MKLLFRVLILACIFGIYTHPCFGETAEYFYDDTGRLVRVIKGTEGVIYQYDEAGNLLSISRGAISANPPLLQGINPDLLFTGSVTLVRTICCLSWQRPLNAPQVKALEPQDPLVWTLESSDPFYLGFVLNGERENETGQGRI